MSKSFTPGPWVIEDPMGEENPWIVEANKQTYEWRCLAIVPWGDEVPRTEGEANARLIAAAPDLAELANEAPILSQYHGQHGFEVERFIADYEAWGTKRRAVLAKARGD